MFTVESGMPLNAKKGHKGELTSLSGLRDLLGKEEAAETKDKGEDA